MMNEGTINQMGVEYYGDAWVYKPKSKKQVGFFSYDVGPSHIDGASSSQAPPAVGSSKMMAVL